MLRNKTAYKFLGGGLFVVLLFFFVLSYNFSDTPKFEKDFSFLTYQYKIISEGGMGTGLEVYSRWEGLFNFYFVSSRELKVTPFQTQAVLRVSNHERQDILEKVIPLFEQTAHILLNDEGMPKNIKLSFPDHVEVEIEEIVANQFRSILNYLILPQLQTREFVETHCLMGRCTYTVTSKRESSSSVELQVQRQLQADIALLSNYELSFTPHGLMNTNIGNERLDIQGQDVLALRGDSSWRFERVESTGECCLPPRERVVHFNFSMAEVSLEMRVAQAKADLEDISFEQLINRAKTKMNEPLAAYGTLYSLIKSQLLLEPETAMMFADELKQLEDKNSFYTVVVTALGSDGSASAQNALLDLIEHFDQRDDDFEVRSLMLSLSYATNPTTQALEFVRQSADWGEALETRRQETARLVSGTMAHHLLQHGDNDIALDMIGLSDRNIDFRQMDERELIFHLEAMGNSGHPEVASHLFSMLNESFAPDIKETILYSLRLIPQEEVADLLIRYSKSDDSEMAQAAQRALDLRCRYCLNCERACP